MSEYTTQSLYQGSYCMTVGLKIKNKEQRGDKYSVTFEGDNAEETAMKFYSKTKVDAKTLFDNYRNLKDFIFQRQ